MRFFFDGFSLFGALFTVVFAMTLVIAILAITRGVREWNRNNNSPRLTVPARVVSKRMDVSGNFGGDHGSYTSTSTVYYVTFQVKSGDRMELRVGGKEYGLLAEGDTGNLTFQGTRFLSFDRFLD